MNEVLKAIADRNSCRDFTGEPLTKDQQETLVKAALAAPSAMNLQPWHIIVCNDKALIEQMDADGIKILSGWEDKSSYNRMMERGGNLFYNAPCMMVVLEKEDARCPGIDSGILVQNLALAAHSMQLGNVICAMANIPLSGSNGEDYKKQLKFPSGYKFGVAILIGKANAGKQPHELDMQKVTYV